MKWVLIYVTIVKNGQEVKYSRFVQDDSVSEGEYVYIHWRPEKAVAIKKYNQEAV